MKITSSSGMYENIHHNDNYCSLEKGDDKTLKIS